MQLVIYSVSRFVVVAYVAFKLFYVVSVLVVVCLKLIAVGGVIFYFVGWKRLVAYGAADVVRRIGDFIAPVTVLRSSGLLWTRTESFPLKQVMVMEVTLWDTVTWRISWNRTWHSNRQDWDMLDLTSELMSCPSWICLWRAFREHSSLLLQENIQPDSSSFRFEVGTNQKAKLNISLHHRSLKDKIKILSLTHLLHLIVVIQQMMLPARFVRHLVQFILVLPLLAEIRLFLVASLLPVALPFLARYRRRFS